MLKLLSTLRFINVGSQFCQKVRLNGGFRCLLSEAYRCDSAWVKRLQTPLFQKLNLDELYQAIDQKFSHDGKASVIDIDLFANAVQDESYVDELEDIIHKLRMSPSTTNTLPSTLHAVIRFYVQLEQYDSLIKILDDRLNYGIFLDDYCACLLLDTLIEKKKISEAARASSILMLQEDWSHPLVTALALYSCHLYVQNPSPWKAEEEEEDNGEEVKVRVPYIRNPYFDDHFDLRDPQLLVGKTLATIGVTMKDPLGATYHLIGLGMYRKWEKATLYLQKLLNGEVKLNVFSSGIKVFEETLEKELNDENDPEAKIRERLRGMLKELREKGLVVEGDMHEAVVSKVQLAVAQEENTLVKSQQAVYDEWVVSREQSLEKELQEARRRRRIAAIEEEKEKLEQRQQELFFFDNEEKFDLLLEEKATRDAQAEAQSSPSSKLEAKNVEEAYIPPEIRRTN